MDDQFSGISHWTVTHALARQAQSQGDRPFVIFTDGTELTYRQALRDAEQIAGHFHDLGVRPGDRVIVMLPNSLDFIRIWAALSRLRAIMVTLNTHLQGPILASQIERSRASWAAIGPGCEEAFLSALSAGDRVADLIGVGARIGSGKGRRVHDFADWESASPYAGALPEYSDISCIMYTSGTTGPSKGVLMPQAHCYLMGLGMAENAALTPEDRCYTVLPLFHVNGLFLHVYATLIGGGTVILRDRFSARNWLSDVLRFEATVTHVVAAVTSFLFALPETPEEKRTRLRLVMAGPNLPEHARIWTSRFAIPEVLSAYGMTECGIPTWGRTGEGRLGSIGKVFRPYYDLRIVDTASGLTLPAGQAGEILVRPMVPSGFMQGYDGMPEATVQATRNLWFSTGDLGLIDDDGYVFFIDRLGDRIRRRGENISSFEVECAIELLDGIKEAAAFAVPGDIGDGEDELMIAVVLQDGSDLDVDSIADHAFKVLPRFSRPRYIEILESLPRTQTHKVQKKVLRERGVTKDTWDVLAERYMGTS